MRLISAGPADLVHSFQASSPEPVVGYAVDPAPRERRTLLDTRRLRIAALTGLTAATLRQ